MTSELPGHLSGRNLSSPPMTVLFIISLVLLISAANAACVYWGWKIGIPIGRRKYFLITLFLMLLMAAASRAQGGGAVLASAAIGVYGCRKLGNRLLDAGVG